MTQQSGTPSGVSLRWGFLGTGRIARKVLQPFREAGAEIVSVGAGTPERAREFATEFEIPHAAESYAGVLERPEVEAVYIGLANGQHFRWALECARARKHCLLEKPLVLSPGEARELRVAFATAHRRLMEAFMWRHLPQTAWILRQVEAGEIGELKRINAAFSFALDRPRDYRWSDDNGGGALWDIGCYCLNAARLFFGAEPKLVSARSAWVRPGGVADASTAGWCEFSGDRLLSFSCAFTTPFHQEFTLLGSAGSIRVVNPFFGTGPIQLSLLPAERSFERIFEPANPYGCMAEHFMRAVRDPGLALLPGEDGVVQTRALDALARSARAGGTPVSLEE